jgi:hypothetical protein
MLMKKFLLATLMIGAISFSACRETVAEFDNTLPPVQSGNTTSPSGDSNSLKISPSEPVTAQPKSVQNNMELNPEHGQPGHRCEIAVGAPLNSSPAASNIPVPAPQRTTPGNSVTINPPHGQPGHDCAIPVGQPLKS